MNHRLSLQNNTAGVRERGEWNCGTSDIEGKATRVGASECGQRTSFNRTREVGSADDIRARASVASNEGVLVIKSEVIPRPPVGSIEWLGDLVRHDCDVGFSVARALDDTPAKVRKESLSTRREEIKCTKAARGCLANNVLRECATDAPLPLCRSDENAGEPRRVLWPSIHLMVHEHS
jgi:hypothetical protein